jgi:hypothetical protein
MFVVLISVLDQELVDSCSVLRARLPFTTIDTVRLLHTD